MTLGAAWGWLVVLTRLSDGQQPCAQMRERVVGLLVLSLYFITIKKSHRLGCSIKLCGKALHLPMSNQKAGTASYCSVVLLSCSGGSGQPPEAGSGGRLLARLLAHQRAPHPEDRRQVRMYLPLTVVVQHFLFPRGRRMFQSYDYSSAVGTVLTFACKCAVRHACRHA